MNSSNSAYFAYLAAITLLTVFTYCWIVRQSKVKSKEEKNKAIKKSTFRITGIPIDWDHSKLQSFLEAQESITSASIESLALESHGGPQVATATFEGMPHQNDRSWSILMPASSNDRKQYLVIDEDFHGMTALYTPPLQDHKIDIIALSGLGGHAFGSFKERGGSHMWLRDSLPFDLTLDTSDQPISRVMIYGYDSVVAESKSMQNIEDLATGLIGGLQKLANASIIQPIILIGHSLGGLIIKQALISLSRSEKEDDRNLVRAIYGVVFFGTPHDGMDITSLIPMAGNSSPNRSLIESLNRNNSQVLTAQQRDFHKALGEKGSAEVFCFYETLESPTAQQDRYGNWTMTGPTTILVTKSSATHCRPWEDGAEHICAINRTHSEMVKFGPHDADYQNVRERLSGLSRRAFASRDRLQTSRSIFLVPYSPNPNFIARAGPLNDIKKQFGLDQQGASVQSRKRVSLYGLGGVGKTQIAIAYAYWLQKASPDISVFWVHASNIDRFRQSYASIAKKCSIPGHDGREADMLLLVSNWLEQQTKMRWLMIIDNADDMDIFSPNQLTKDAPDQNSQTTAALTSGNLARYIPDCNHGSVLITTRDKKAGIRLCQGLSPVEIDHMTDEEAHQLMQRIISTQQISTAETACLLSKLEYLPLALAQAASFIQENDISIEEYVQLLDESDSSFIDLLSESFETVGRDSETPHAVTATWILSFNQIKRKEPLISDILSFLSFFHFQAIPKAFVESFYQQRYQEQIKGNMPATAVLVKALGTLKAFSFISEGEDKSLTMHRLVQLVTQKWVVNEGQMDKIATFALRTMLVNYPFAEFNTHEICMRYLPHANSVLAKNKVGLDNDQEIAFLLSRLITYFLFKGDGVKAEVLTIQAREMLKRVLGENHPETIKRLNYLAAAYLYQGRYKEAEDLGVQVLGIYRAVLGVEDINTLQVMHNLASIYFEQKQWKEAEELGVQANETCKRVLGEEHPSTLNSFMTLALTYLNQGRLGQAEGLLVELLELCKKVLGLEHHLTMLCMSYLSSAYQKQLRWKEAESLELQATEIKKRVLGEEHPHTITSINNLAFIYHRQGLLEQAEKLGTRLIEVERRVLGESHRLTLITSTHLMEVYQGQKRWKEAEDIAIRVLEANKTKLGQDHPDISNILVVTNNLGLMYQHRRRWQEAEAMGRRSLELSKRFKGEDNVTTLIILGNVSLALKGLGKTNEALTKLADCVARLERTRGRDDSTTKIYVKILERWRERVEEPSK